MTWLNRTQASPEATNPAKKTNPLDFLGTEKGDYQFVGVEEAHQGAREDDNKNDWFGGKPAMATVVFAGYNQNQKQAIVDFITKLHDDCGQEMPEKAITDNRHELTVVLHGRPAEVFDNMQKIRAKQQQAAASAVSR